jgi:acetyltransferase-like isoleucine patch superfamily enzyme
VAVVTALAPYADDRGNSIVVDGSVDTPVHVDFQGAHNKVVVEAPLRLAKLRIIFNCDNGVVELRRSQGVAAFSATIRVGQDSTVIVGRNVSAVGSVVISAVEGTSVKIGDDVMFASENEVRADDAHPIFDVRTQKRVNVSQSVTIGNHVWLARGAAVLPGASIGDGSVIGFRSVVTRKIPNNCVAAGVPAKVVRRDIAWERPHLSLVEPFYKPDASTVKKSAYWHLTDSPTHPGISRRARRGLRSRVRDTRFAAALARSPKVRALLRRG